MNRSLTLVVLSLVVGCAGGDSNAPTLHPVTGTVTYNGDPLSNAQVTLVSDEGGLVAVGQSDAQGVFTVTTKGIDGAVSGNHQVAVVAMDGSGGSEMPDEGSEEYAKMMSGEGAKPESRIPEKYSNASTSGLTATVTEGENQITVELTD